MFIKILNISLFTQVKIHAKESFTSIFDIEGSRTVMQVNYFDYGKTFWDKSIGIYFYVFCGFVYDTSFEK